MRLGLRGRIALLVLVALAPPAAIGFAIALEERSEAHEHAQRDMLDSARLAAADVERVMEATATFLGGLSRELGRQRDRRYCENLLGLVPRATNRYTFVGVAGPAGAVSCWATREGSDAPMKSVNVSRAGWFRAAQVTGGFVLGRVGVGPLSSADVLLAGHPVPGPPGSRPGVMFAAVNLRQLAQAASLDEAPRGTSFVVVDDRGTVVARAPGDGSGIGRRLPERPLVEIVLREGQGTAEIKGLDGVKRIHGFTPVGEAVPAGAEPGGQLFVTAGRSSESVFAEPDADLRRYLLLAAAGLLLALVLSWLATKLLLQRWTDGVVESARRFGAGDLTARAPEPRGLGELTDVARAINAAADEIEHRQAEQARLLAELVAAEEETRRRIAADIHDDTAQAVAAVGLRMDTLISELEDPEAREVAVNAREALAEANRRLRRLLFELRPPALDEAGIAAAVELFLTDAFGQNGIDWRVDNRLGQEPSPEVRSIIYRVALEALTNVMKHSGADRVEVMLERRGVGVAVRVRDNGRGFDLPAPDAPAEPGHIGLLTMRERAEAAGGRFSLSSSLGAGTLVEFWMPEPNGNGHHPA